MLDVVTYEDDQGSAYGTISRSCSCRIVHLYRGPSAPRQLVSARLPLEQIDEVRHSRRAGMRPVLALSDGGAFLS
jgi:hypothetical protein